MSIGPMLFNPFTGTPRRPEDIASDPHGRLIWDGEASIFGARPAVEVGAEFELLVQNLEDAAVGYGMAQYNSIGSEASEAWLERVAARVALLAAIHTALAVDGKEL